MKLFVYKLWVYYWETKTVVYGCSCTVWVTAGNSLALKEELRSRCSSCSHRSWNEKLPWKEKAGATSPHSLPTPAFLVLILSCLLLEATLLLCSHTPNLFLSRTPGVQQRLIVCVFLVGACRESYPHVVEINLIIIYLFLQLCLCALLLAYV